MAKLATRAALAAAALTAFASGAAAQEFEPPRRLEADGRPIDVAGGNAAPLAWDFDRDGRLDLLVGAAGASGRAHVFRNTSAAGPAQLVAAGVVAASGGDARVPTR
jgi:hypothetical protein